MKTFTYLDPFEYESTYTLGRLLQFQEIISDSIKYRTSRSTQRAVLQNSCSTEDILLGKLIQFYVLMVVSESSSLSAFDQV